MSGDRRIFQKSLPSASPTTRMRIETLAAHAGHAVDPTTGAVTPPIHLSTTFEREPDGSYRQGHIYARTSNPNRAAAGGGCSPQLEGGSSRHRVLLGIRRDPCRLPGARAGRSRHRAGRRVLRHAAARCARCSRRGASRLDACDMSDLGAVERLLRPTTKLVWVETPSNPLAARRRHRGARDARARRRRALRRGQHLGDAAAPAPARPRRRRRHALHDEVSRRPQRSHRRRARRPRGRRLHRAAPHAAGARRRDPVAVRLLAAACAASARCPGACAATAPTRSPSRASSRRTRRSKPCTTPDSPSHPGHDIAARQMKRLRRHAEHPAARRRARRARPHEPPHSSSPAPRASAAPNRSSSTAHRSRAPRRSRRGTCCASPSASRTPTT